MTELRKSHAAPTDLLMRSVNMPHYRGPRILPVTKTSKAADALHIQSLLTDIVILSCTGNMLLSNIPVHFGQAVPPSCRSTAPPHALLNSEFASYPFQAMYFCWAVYLFSNRHFSSTIQSQHLPFHISLACDTSDAGHLLFAEFLPEAKFLSSGNDFLHYVWASGETSIVQGYLSNSYPFFTSKVTTAFWKLQLAIITQLRLIRWLSLIVTIVIPDHDRQSVKAFLCGLTSAHWKVSLQYASYLEISNSIVDSCTVIIAVHLSSALVVKPLVLKTPPAVCPKPKPHSTSQSTLFALDGMTTTSTKTTPCRWLQVRQSRPSQTSFLTSQLNIAYIVQARMLPSWPVQASSLSQVSVRC